MHQQMKFGYLSKGSDKPKCILAAEQYIKRETKHLISLNSCVCTFREWPYAYKCNKYDNLALWRCHGVVDQPLTLYPGVPSSILASPFG